MNWFRGSYKDNPFEMFSTSHLTMIAILLFISVMIFIFRSKLSTIDWRFAEIGLAVTLIIFEITYHIWMNITGIWDVSHSIPLELCNISFFLMILLLLTRKKIFFEILVFTGLLGASQALITPLLHYDVPHFRFFHFFFTHLMMIWVPLYFAWVKGYRPTIYSVIKLFVFLNVLMPVIIFINKMVNGNYMFLRHKPSTASLLDYLGPYPFYIISMEGLLITLSIIVWLLFREKSLGRTIGSKDFPN